MKFDLARDIVNESRFSVLADSEISGSFHL